MFKTCDALKALSHLSKMQNDYFNIIVFFSIQAALDFYKKCQKNNIFAHLNKISAVCFSENIAKSIEICGFKATIFTQNANINEIIALIEKL